MCMLIKHLQEPAEMQGETRMDESKNGHFVHLQNF